MSTSSRPSPSPPRLGAGSCNPRLGAGLWMFGQFVDRYATDAYGPPVGTLEAIARAGQVGGLELIDINYPFPEPDLRVETVRQALADAGLRAAAVTPVIFNRDFARGSFTHPDPGVRGKTLDRACAAVEVARALGAGYVKFWPGQDGYDAPFQADHLALWDLTVEGIGAVARKHPEVQFAIEYKSKEPRTHIVLGSAARTLLAIQDMNASNVGVVMDLGHSLFAKETPAEEVRLLARRGKLVSVECNDNWRAWDDDLPVGAVHLVESLEFVLALEQLGWDGPLLLDQFPFREDPVGAARASLRALRQLFAAAARLDRVALADAQARQDLLSATRVVHEAIFAAEAAPR